MIVTDVTPSSSSPSKGGGLPSPPRPPLLSLQPPIVPKAINTNKANTPKNEIHLFLIIIGLVFPDITFLDDKNFSLNQQERRLYLLA
jgi:hypothetical protein